MMWFEPLAIPGDVTTFTPTGVHGLDVQFGMDANVLRTSKSNTGKLKYENFTPPGNDREGPVT